MNVKISVSHGFLEGSLRIPADREPVGAAVFCHPHPLHGGTMHTKAVFRAAQALNEAGWAALRFNFRGVGGSTGTHGHGEGELEDARAALDWMNERYPGLPLLLGGFSFGSRVALRVAASDPRVVGVVALGAPIRMYGTGFLKGFTGPLLIVQGEEDEFGPGAELRAAAASVVPDASVRIVPGADHYFHGHFEELQEAIVDWIRTLDGGNP